MTTSASSERKGTPVISPPLLLAYKLPPAPRRKNAISSQEKKKNPIQIETPLFDLVAEELGGERAMAAEEGVVIACHNKDEFDAQMTKAKEAGKVVRFLAQNFGDFFFWGFVHQGVAVRLRSIGFWRNLGFNFLLRFVACGEIARRSIVSILAIGA